jgi:hypothetical protein
MMHDLIEKKRGKETVVMSDELPKVRAQMKRLRDSQRGLKVEYFTRPSGETAKYKKKPNNHRGD